MTDNNERSLEVADKVNNELQQINEPTEEVYTLPEKVRDRSMLWSILSLVLGIISVFACQIWGLALILALVSLGLSVFARHKLGYFDKIAIFGLIISIIGVVFGVFSAVISISGIFNALS